jgi:hypothetical protein
MPIATAHPSPFRPAWDRTAVAVAVAAGAAAVFTLVVTFTPSLSFAYRSVEAHMAIETAAAFTTALGAVLFYGRFARTGYRRDLLLFAAMVLFAGTNALFSVLPRSSVPTGPAR